MYTAEDRINEAQQLTDYIAETVHLYIRKKDTVAIGMAGALALSVSLIGLCAERESRQIQNQT